jgi:hypothetical protein
VKGLTERLKAAAYASGGMFDAFEGILAETIREISRANPTRVGLNLMSILLPAPKLQRPRVKFLPLENHEVSLSSSTATETLTVYYTPWIIAPRILHPPKVQIGDSVVGVDGFGIDVVGANPAGSLLGLDGSYKRPAPPDR